MSAANETSSFEILFQRRDELVAQLPAMKNVEFDSISEAAEEIEALRECLEDTVEEPVVTFTRL